MRTHCARRDGGGDAIRIADPVAAYELIRMGVLTPFRSARPSRPDDDDLIWATPSAMRIAIAALYQLTTPPPLPPFAELPGIHQNFMDVKTLARAFRESDGRGPSELLWTHLMMAALSQAIPSPKLCLFPGRRAGGGLLDLWVEVAPPDIQPKRFWAVEYHLRDTPFPPMSVRRTRL
jgi:hypothetical protein